MSDATKCPHCGRTETDRRVLDGRYQCEGCRGWWPVGVTPEQARMVLALEIQGASERADRIGDLAERIACSPLGATLFAGLAMMGDEAKFAVACHGVAAALLVEREAVRTRAKAAACEGSTGGAA